MNIIYSSILAIIALFTMGCTEQTKANPIITEPEETIILYKNGDNSQTIKISKNEVDLYTMNWEWSIEPTTLMYTADGRQSYIWNSEVDDYSLVGWSIYQPITLYSSDGKTISCLVEEKQAYLDTGKW